MHSTCRLAVVIALFILKTDSIVIALIFVITVNLPQAMVFFTFTFLTAVISIPHFIELARRNDSYHTFWTLLSKCTHFWQYWNIVHELHFLNTSYMMPFLSTHPHCWIDTQNLPLCTKPSSHTHPGTQASLLLQPGGPCRCAQVGLQAGIHVV